MFKFFIDGIEVKCDSQFDIEEEFMNPSELILTNVYPANWTIDDLMTNYYFPEDYTKCHIYKDDELYFVGIVKNSADMELNPLKPHYCSLQILDPSTLLSEGMTLDFVIANKTVTEAINQVINNIADYGFVAGNIQIPAEYDTVIGAYSTLEKAPYDVFQYLSQISLTRWGTHMVDEDTTAIDFFSPELLDNQGTIELTKEYCNSNHIESITYDYSTDDYRNRQVMTSDQVFASNTTTNTRVANGYDTTYLLEKDVGSIVRITVNNNEATFISTTEKDDGDTADFYYEYGSNELEAETTYGVGTIIQVEYIALVNGREVVINSSEINRIQTNLGRNGNISRYENRSDVTSSTELQLVGQSYIKYKGLAEITLTVSSRDDFLILGGKYYFDAPLTELSGDYLVKAKKTTVTQNSDYCWGVYEYELTNSFDTENELNYFDNQRSKNSGNIEEGESIDRNIDMLSYNNIYFSNLKIEDLGENVNVLQSALGGLL